MNENIDSENKNLFFVLVFKGKVIKRLVLNIIYLYIR